MEAKIQAELMSAMKEKNAEKTAAIREIKTAIMKFDGSNPFTIIQQYLESSNVPVTSFIDGDIYVLGGSVWVINEKTVFFYEQGMEYGYSLFAL